MQMRFVALLSLIVGLTVAPNTIAEASGTCVAYVTNKEPDTVSVVDTTTNTITPAVVP